MPKPQSQQEKPKTYEEEKAAVDQQRAYEEKILSGNALATKMLVEAGLKKKIEDIPDEELANALDSNFEAIEINPVEYIKINISEIRKILSLPGISKANAEKARKLIAASWQSVSRANMLPDVDKKEIENIQEYLLTAERYMDSNKL